MTTKALRPQRGDTDRWQLSKNRAVEKIVQCQQGEQIKEKRKMENKWVK
jgi:hypothetical protein